MLLLECDTPPPPVISSSLKCQKCPEKRKQSKTMPFSLNILSRTFFVIWFLLLSLLRAIFFYLYYVFISFSAFGKWRYFILYCMERSCEVMERSTQNCLLLPPSIEAEYMVRSSGDHWAFVRKDFRLDYLGFSSPWENIVKGTQVSGWGTEHSTPMSRRPLHKFTFQLIPVFFTDQLEIHFHWEFFLERLISHPQQYLCASVSHVLVSMTTRVSLHRCQYLLVPVASLKWLKSRQGSSLVFVSLTPGSSW